MSDDYREYGDDPAYTVDWAGTSLSTDDGRFDVARQWHARPRVTEEQMLIEDGHTPEQARAILNAFEDGMNERQWERRDRRRHE